MFRFSAAILSSMFFVAAWGCAITSLTPEGEKVRLVHADPVGCKELGTVAGFNPWALSPDQTRQGIMNKMRNEAAKLGANQVVIDKMWGMECDGIAYRCDSASGTASSANAK